MEDTVRIVDVDLADPAHAPALLTLLDHYARDPMGGGTPLSAYARSHVTAGLAQAPGYHGALAWAGAEAIGLINTFTGFSTFAARPLLNIHDIVVHADWRGRGVGRRLLQWAEARALALDCCKLTLEVLSGNAAIGLYRKAGFAPYVLDPAAGSAVLLQKILSA